MGKGISEIKRRKYTEVIVKLKNQEAEFSGNSPGIQILSYMPH